MQPLGNLLVVPGELNRVAAAVALCAVNQLREAVFVDLCLVRDIVRDEVRRCIQDREQHCREDSSRISELRNARCVASSDVVGSVVAGGVQIDVKPTARFKELRVGGRDGRLSQQAQSTCELWLPQREGHELAPTDRIRRRTRLRGLIECTLVQCAIELVGLGQQRRVLTIPDQRTIALRNHLAKLRLRPRRTTGNNVEASFKLGEQI